MAINGYTGNKSLATKDDVVQAARAITHELKSLIKRSETEVALNIGKSLEHRLESLLVKELDRKIKSLVADYEKKIQELQMTYESGMERLKMLLENLPTPRVIIPEKAIQVNVDQPPNVIIPDKAIQVQVETKAFLEQQPRKSIVQKSILYDPATGRPAKIVEELNEE